MNCFGDSELSSFLALPLIKRKDCPFEFWKANNITFPNLASLARKFLSTPASSVYSARLFSEAGNIYEDHRSRLLPQNAEKLAFIHHNLPIYNYQY